MKQYGLNPDLPILTQISRFERLKDPIGVIRTYRMVRRYHDCQLLLAGGGASDDPEGQEVLSEIREASGDDPDIHVLELPPFSDLDINALVRGSTGEYKNQSRKDSDLQSPRHCGSENR